MKKKKKKKKKVDIMYRDLFLRYKMGIIIWSPLECGILTGKYIDDIPVILKYFLLIFK